MTTQKLSYMQEADVWLTEQLNSLESSGQIDAVKQALKDRIYQSFQNGQKMCPKCNPRKPR